MLRNALILIVLAISCLLAGCQATSLNPEKSAGYYKPAIIYEGGNFWHPARLEVSSEVAVVADAEFDDQGHPKKIHAEVQSKVTPVLGGQADRLTENFLALTTTTMNYNLEYQRQRIEALLSGMAELRSMVAMFIGNSGGAAQTMPPVNRLPIPRGSVPTTPNPAPLVPAEPAEAPAVDVPPATAEPPATAPMPDAGGVTPLSGLQEVIPP